MKPITTMLELQKLVLKNVYGNIILFEKELWKSIKWLENDELHSLYNWAINEFNEQQHSKIINYVFVSFDSR
jgi:hypothetical protein